MEARDKSGFALGETISTFVSIVVGILTSVSALPPQIEMPSWKRGATLILEGLLPFAAGALGSGSNSPDATQ